jgi:hypothetical protein
MDNRFRIPEFAPLYTAIEIRAEVAQLQGGYRVNLWRCIANAYAVALIMSSNLEAYKAFLDEDFWQSKKKRPNAENILLNVMLFVFNVTTDNAYSRAWKYAKALEACFADGVPSEQIRDLIEEEGGIEAMLKKAVKNGLADDEKVCAALHPDADDVEIDVPDPVADEDQDENEEDDENRVRPTKKSARPRDKKAKPSKAKASDIRKDKEKHGSGKRQSKLQDNVPVSTPDRFRLLVDAELSPKFHRLKLGQTAAIHIQMVEHLGMVRPEMISFKKISR